MRRIGIALAVTLIGAAAAAQDIAGIEDCTKTSGLDKRTGCLQANVNFLQRTLTKYQLEAHRRLQAAESEIAALKAAVSDLQKQVATLQAARKAEQDKTGEKADGKKK